MNRKLKKYIKCNLENDKNNNKLFNLPYKFKNLFYEEDYSWDFEDVLNEINKTLKIK